MLYKIILSKNLIYSAQELISYSLILSLKLKLSITAFRIMTLSIMTFSIRVHKMRHSALRQRVVLSVANKSCLLSVVYAECRKAEYRYTECRYTYFCNAECHGA